MKKNNKKGFTLAELLVVVAIIGILVAISIPIFTSQLEKAREATDVANMRAAKAAVVTAYLSDTTVGTTKLGSEQAADVAVGTIFYDAAKGTLTTTAPTAYGKGTATPADGTGTADLFAGYNGKTVATGKSISIGITKDGVISEVWQ